MKSKYILTSLAVIALPNFALAKLADQPMVSTGPSALTTPFQGEEKAILGRESSGVETMAKDEKDDEKDDDDKDEKKDGGSGTKLLGHANLGAQVMEKEDDDDKEEQGEH